MKWLSIWTCVVCLSCSAVFTAGRMVLDPLYPVACAPQAWSAGAPFLLLASCLGLRIDAPKRVVRFSNPYLPDIINELRISSLAVGDAKVDLIIARRERGLAVRAVRKKGDVEVLSAPN